MTEPRFFTSSILPVLERLLIRGGGFRRLPLRVRVGYFHHPHLGHTLIDTGYCNARTMRKLQRGPLLAAYRLLIRPTTLTDDPLGTGLRLLGLRKEDIRTVILTHFHADHIGGLRELPGTRILCSRKAWQAYTGNSTTRNAMKGIFGNLLPDDMQERIGFFEDFSSVAAPNAIGDGWDIGEDGTVLAIDLPGHLEGHVGLCFPKRATPLLYATDTQWLIKAILEDRPPGFPASLICHDHAAMRASIETVGSFHARGGEVMLCHDPQAHTLDLDIGLEGGY